jgi:hypothetical protein
MFSFIFHRGTDSFIVDSRSLLCLANSACDNSLSGYTNILLYEVNVS